MSAAPATTVPIAVGRARLHAGLVAAYVATLFLNAALLFAVQPMFSKMALPLLGGAPAVWNTCMLVFQALLLGGYLYAHILARRLAVARQVALHAALLGASLLALPVALPERWSTPAGDAPVTWLVALVVAGVGLPFFLLSAAAPLAQQWFARSDHPEAGSPYFLYAASNAGSLLALLAYPFIIEPSLTVTTQRRLWSGAYVAVALLVTACGVVAMRRGRPVARAAGASTDAGHRGAHAGGMAARDPSANDLPAGAVWRERIWWMLLAFAPSSLLLGVTTYLTTDVAAVPLLWVVPLALYLLTFVLAFARRPPLSHRLVLRLQPLVLLPLVVALFSGRTGDLRTMAPLHLVVFFVTAMVCHGELARLRPDAARLTELYLWMSVGGVLGGAFNVLVAPVLFDRVLEYQIVLAVACALRPWPEGAARDVGALRRDVLLPLLLAATVVALLRYPGEWNPLYAIYGPAAVSGIAAAVCLLLVRRPLRFALGVLGVLAAGLYVGAAGREALYRERSFFGVYAVRATVGGYHTLHHGTTLHGAQHMLPPRNREPLTYYRILGPLGDLVGLTRLGRPALRVAVVGLGAGSVACHARDGDHFTFYEIDPAIERIARDTRFFTYLRDCTPDAPVVIGDARLSLARATDERYDLIVLDAFSSDAIPVHLLTREALAVYESRLAERGVLALHVSNRYLDLAPVVADVAGDAGMHAMAGVDRRVSDEARAQFLSRSIWMAVAREESTLRPLALTNRWAVVPAEAGRRIWTDDYSNVLGVLRGR